MAFLSSAKLAEMGFSSVGENVLISDRASFYNCRNIIIGSNVRIDDFCILSAGAGGIRIGDFIHIAAYSSLIGAGTITLNNYSGLSSRVTIYSSSDDYSGSYMTNPTIPSKLTNINNADVVIGKHVIVGAGSVILPGTILEDGVAIGALSLVSKKCESYWIYAGQPAKKIKERKKDIKKLETKLFHYQK